MKNIKLKFIILIGVFILTGIILNLSSSSISLETKRFTYMDSDGKQKTTTIIDEPLERKILNISEIISFSLGFSIFIAVFISGKIEEKQLKSQAEELKTLKEGLYIDIHDALFEKIIPKEIFQVIKKEIINQDMIRKDAEWILDFTLDEVNEENINLRFTCRYKAYNNCVSTIKNPISRVTNTTNNTESEIEKVICTLNSKTIVLYDKEDMENNHGVRIEEINNNLHKINYELEIPPNQYVEYTTVFKIKYKSFVQDEFFTMLPQIDVKLTATYPDNYEFKVVPLLSQDLVLKLKEKGRSMYAAEGGILPRQGIIYYLEKKQA